MLTSFAKYHGLGNDFVLVDARRGDRWPTASAAVRLCDRRRGIGADGVITLLPARSGAAALRMHLYNADGSVAEMCGNGLRTVVHLALVGRAGGHVTVDTDAGLREGWIEASGRVRVTLGAARLVDPAITADVGGAPRIGVGISMGNPHLVLGPFEAGVDLRALAARDGPGLERHVRFPERVNVGFVGVAGPHAIRDVVFERGAGITDACGTGAAAAAVAMCRLGAVRPEDERVTVELLGGPLEVRIEGDPARRAEPGDELARVEIAGEAVHVFDGAVELADGELQPVERGARA
ncbi:diaminopimelate epimerase [Myxococcota bacterium]|nr:diaminopimelate epimerase [Myxococcota bacterium]